MRTDEVDKLFLTDENGCYINLVLPDDLMGPELNLIGRKAIDLSLDEIVRVKRYAGKLYEEAVD